MLHDVIISKSDEEGKRRIICFTNCSKVELTINNKLKIEGLDDDGYFYKTEFPIGMKDFIKIEEGLFCDSNF